jgi:hypothetical protein
MQGMKLEMVFAQSIGQLSHLLLVAVTEMRRCAENLDCRNLRARNFGKQRWRERLMDVAVCRQNALHNFQNLCRSDLQLVARLTTTN